jgi:type I restriction enzyme, S subunit
MTTQIKDWARSLPASWSLERLRFLIDFIESGTSVNAVDVPADEGQFGVLKTSAVYTRKFRPEENKAVIHEEWDRVSCPVREGAIVVSRMNTPDLVGAAGLVREAPANIYLPDRLWQVVVESERCCAAYLHWFMCSQAYSDQIRIACSGSSSSMQNLGQDQFRNFDSPRPPLNVQHAIASYLDAETARIDQLIEEKQKVMDVLLDSITSLAARCLQIAEEKWIRLEHVSELIQRPVHQVSGCTYTKLGLLNRGRGIFKKHESEQEDMGDSDFFWIESGDLIISGQFAWEGAVALATEEHAGCVVSHRFPVVRGKPGVVLTEYLFALLASKHGEFLLNDCSRGSAGRNRPLNMRSLLKWKIPVPTMDDQAEIARLVTLREKVRFSTEQSIELLKELRSATITDAVLGRIDVLAHMKH